jgi:hypothetical protein
VDKRLEIGLISLMETLAIFGQRHTKTLAGEAATEEATAEETTAEEATAKEAETTAAEADGAAGKSEQSSGAASSTKSKAEAAPTPAADSSDNEQVRLLTEIVQAQQSQIAQLRAQQEHMTNVLLAMKREQQTSEKRSEAAPQEAERRSQPERTPEPERHAEAQVVSYVEPKPRARASPPRRGFGATSIVKQLAVVKS